MLVASPSAMATCSSKDAAGERGASCGELVGEGGRDDLSDLEADGQFLMSRRVSTAS